MGRSAGTGSPAWFMCPNFRRLDWRTRDNPIERQMHSVTLTGRSKPYRTKTGSALGSRSSRFTREFRCACSYVGWSNHKDLERMEERGTRRDGAVGQRLRPRGAS